MTPSILCFLLAPAILAAPYRGTIDLSDRTELRGGYFGLPTDPALNAETVPSITATVATRDSSAMLNYAPRLGLTDVQLGFFPSYLHSGGADLAWRSRPVQISLTEYASYGTLNYSSLQLPSSASPGVLRVDPLLRRIITYEGSSTTLAVQVTPWRSWILRLVLSYSRSGGASAADRAVLPFYQGPRAESSVDYGISSGVRLVTRASLEKIDLSTRYEYAFLQATEGMVLELARTTQAAVAAGVSEVRTDVPLPRLARRYDSYGTVEAQINHRLPYRDRFDLQARALLGPMVNRVTGLVTQQIQALARVRLRSEPWTSVFEGGFSDSLHDGPGELTILSGQLAIGYRVSRNVEIETGTRFAWQEVGGSDSPTIQKLAFVAVTLREPTLHF